MKFIVDAQLPLRLKVWLAAEGYDTIHTEDFLRQSLTADLEIARVAEAENRIVITKDSDFLKLYILTGKPQKLLLITTGNIVNKDLLALFERNFQTAVKLFVSYNVVEMSNYFVMGHKP